jgi:hypothetical protein
VRDWAREIEGGKDPVERERDREKERVKQNDNCFFK